MSLTKAYAAYAEQSYRYARNGYYRNLLSFVPRIDQCLRVLDVGVGPGGWLWTLAAMMPGRLEMVGGDISPDWLEFARRQLSRIDAKTLEFVRLDAQALPFSDESFQLVISSIMLQEVPNEALACGEIARVLARGGKALVLFHTYRYYVRRLFTKKSMKVKCASLVSLLATILLPVLNTKMYGSTFQTFKGLSRTFYRYRCRVEYQQLGDMGIGVMCVIKQ